MNANKLGNSWKSSFCAFSLKYYLYKYKAQGYISCGLAVIGLGTRIDIWYKPYMIIYDRVNIIFKVIAQELNFRKYFVFILPQENVAHII